LHSWFVQAFAGTGFVAEPYQGSSSKTLLSYLGNVRMLNHLAVHLPTFSFLCYIPLCNGVV